MSGFAWLVLTIPVFVLAAALLIRAVVRLVAVAWAQPLAVVQLAPPPAGSDALDASIELAAPGSVAIAGEGKRMTSDFAGLSVALADAAGRAVPVRDVLVTTTTSGVSRVRLKLASAGVPAAGRYTVTVRGLDPKRSYAESRLLFLPNVPVVGLILQVVATAILMMGALVATGLALFATRGGR
jgi:hypothetical protein